MSFFIVVLNDKIGPAAVKYSDRLNFIMTDYRFSIIYKTKVEDYWYVFNRVCDYDTGLSSSYLKVLDSIGIKFDAKLIQSRYSIYMQTDKTEILGIYDELPNFELQDQQKLNHLKKEFCDTLNNSLDPAEGPKYFCRFDKLFDELHDRNDVISAEQTSGVIIDNMVKSTCRAWFLEIYNSLKIFFKEQTKSDFDDELTQLYSELTNRKSELNRLNNCITKGKQYLYKLKGDYFKETARIQESIAKQKAYKDLLDKKIDLRENKLKQI